MTIRKLCLLPLACAVACNLDSFAGPSVSVEKELGTCFVPCDSSVTSSVPLIHCDGGAVDCTSWAGGRDKFRVVADYGDDLVFTSPGSVPPPGLTVLSSGQPVANTSTFTGSTDGGHYLATAVVLAPVDEELVSFVVSSDAGVNFTSTAGPYQVDDATISAAIAECPSSRAAAAGSCTLAAGEGVATVTVTAPSGLATDGGIVTFSVDDIPAATVTSVVFNTVVDPQQSSGTVSIPAPNSPGSTWALTARISRFTAVLPAITLRRSNPIQLAIADGSVDQSTFPSGSPPQRAAAEADARCRTLTLGIDAPDHTSDNSVALTSSVFSITADGNTSGTTTVDSGGLGFVTLLLPVTPGSDRVASVRATSGPEASGQAALTLSEVGPVSAALAAPLNTATVTASGSPAVTVSGRLAPPRVGLAFPPGTAVTVITRASNTSSATLPCGAPILADAVFCDPGHVDPSTVAPGGCLFDSPLATVASDGSFSVSLAGGICFAGTLTVEVWSRQTIDIDPAKCVGELGTTTAPTMLTSTSIEFSQ